VAPRRISLLSLLVGGWEFWRRRWWATLVTAAVAGLASLLLGVGGRAVLQSLGIAAFVAAAFYIGCVVWAWSHNANYVPDIREVGDGEVFFALIPTSQLKTPTGTSGRCVVRDPDGVEHVSDVLPVWTRFEAEYPRHFPGATPAVPGGQYRVKWYLAGKREDRPRLLLRKRYHVPTQAASA
jgi:hypothetical protein